jgi:hypothetical protein
MTTESERPYKLLQQCAEAAAKDPISIGAVISVLGDRGFPIICILFSLPFIQPIALGPLAIAGGISFTALGWQMMHQRATPWLPQRVLNIKLKSKHWQSILWVLNIVMTVVDMVSKERLTWLVASRGAKRRLGLIVCLAGLLMSIPMFGVPFNNTLPALVVLAASIAEIEHDGLWVLASLCFFVITILYFTVIGWLLLRSGDLLVSWLF